MATKTQKEKSFHRELIEQFITQHTFKSNFLTKYASFNSGNV